MAMLDNILDKLTEEEKTYLNDLINFEDYPQLIKVESHEDDDLANQNEMNIYLLDLNNTEEVWCQFRHDLADFTQTIDYPERNSNPCIGWRKLEVTLENELKDLEHCDRRIALRDNRLKFFGDLLQKRKAYDMAVLDFKRTWKPKEGWKY